jgi:hypothetical protein
LKEFLLLPKTTSQLLRQEMLNCLPFHASALKYKRTRCKILKQNINGYWRRWRNISYMISQRLNMKINLC